jgi:tetratricopeptide (TPR) repeat protein
MRTLGRSGMISFKNFPRGLLILVTIVTGIAPSNFAQNRQRPVPRLQTAISLTIKTEPNTIIWVDEIRRGTTDAAGKLVLNKISSGRHVVRVRANGFKETSIPWASGRANQLSLRLIRTTDQAELAFQEAEETREKAKDEDSRRQAVELYRRALKLRAAFPAAQVGLARVLLDLSKNEEALGAIEAARLSRPIYPEASAVEGRTYREMAFADEAIKSFQRAIREARGLQPEAHVGLARIYEDRGQYEAAATEFETAIKQLSDSEPVIYQLLGATYEKLEKYKEAVGAYEKYLQLAPNGSLAPAVRSIIDQLRREAAGQQLSPE